MIADALERLADTDERLRMVTVTAIDTAPDLRHAVVYTSSLSDESSEALAAVRTELQRVISREVRLKRTPQLSFTVDPGVTHGTHVDEVLRHLREIGAMGDEGDPDGDQPDGDGPEGASPADDGG